MQRVYAIWQRRIKIVPFHSESITVKPKNVIRIDSPYSRLNSLVKLRQAPVLLVTGLIDRIVARYPGVVLISFSYLLPKPDCTVLMVFVIPESGVVGHVV
jgi:hypothetical protein